MFRALLCTQITFTNLENKYNIMMWNELMFLWNYLTINWNDLTTEQHDRKLREGS